MSFFYGNNLTGGYSMNDLSLFNSNQKATSKEVVTTKQLADILGVDVRTVQLTVKRVLDPTKVLSRVINGGKSMIFDEEQATAIKREIQKHHNLANRQVDNATTELELQQNFYAASQAYAKFLEAERARLQAENERQKQQLTEQAPKVEMYNKLVDRSFCKCLRDTAQFIGEHEKHFLQVLQDKKVIYKHAGHYRAYADYADCFELKVYTYGENKTGQQLLVNIKGLELVKKIFKGV